MNLTNLTTALAPATDDRKLANLDEIARTEAAKAFNQLSFLDSAELALVGGGGAHGGNTL